MCAFEKYIEILCYSRELFHSVGTFGSFLGGFLTNFENITEILCYFLCYLLCYLLKIQNSGDLPKFGSRRQLWAKMDNN